MLWRLHRSRLCLELFDKESACKERSREEEIKEGLAIEKVASLVRCDQLFVFEVYFLLQSLPPKVTSLPPSISTRTLAVNDRGGALSGNYLSAPQSPAAGGSDTLGRRIPVTHSRNTFPERIITWLRLALSTWRPGRRSIGLAARALRPVIAARLTERRHAASPCPGRAGLIRRCHGAIDLSGAASASPCVSHRCVCRSRGNKKVSWRHRSGGGCLCVSVCELQVCLQGLPLCLRVCATGVSADKFVGSCGVAAECSTRNQEVSGSSPDRSCALGKGTLHEFPHFAQIILTNTVKKPGGVEQMRPLLSRHLALKGTPSLGSRGPAGSSEERSLERAAGRDDFEHRVSRISASRSLVEAKKMPFSTTSQSVIVRSNKQAQTTVSNPPTEEIERDLSQDRWHVRTQTRDLWQVSGSCERQIDKGNATGPIGMGICMGVLATLNGRREKPALSYPRTVPIRDLPRGPSPSPPPCVILPPLSRIRHVSLRRDVNSGVPSASSNPPFPTLRSYALHLMKDGWALSHLAQVSTQVSSVPIHNSALRFPPPAGVTSTAGRLPRGGKLSLLLARGVGTYQEENGGGHAKRKQMDSNNTAQTKHARFGPLAAVQERSQIETAI
ncbi:hypothetical protein Bbelb_251550 [Branchiostoma belcheri]|nr:hypothetical protein Bbelb_251550 [Branchiostoma belcheri]